MNKRHIGIRTLYCLLSAAFVVWIWPGANSDIAMADTLSDPVALSPLRGMGIVSEWILDESDIVILDRDVEFARLFDECSIVYPSCRLKLKKKDGTPIGIDVEPGTPMRVLEDSNGMLRVLLQQGETVITGYVDRKIYVAKESVPDVFLGILSEKYESNGNPGSVSSGKGDLGGKSYGAWQLSSRSGSLKSFVSSLKETQPDFHGALSSAQKKDGGYGSRFDKAWKAIAADHYDEFYRLQWEFTKAGYYEKAILRAKSRGADIDALMTHVAVRNAVWSAAVQLGWGISGSYLAKLSGMTDPVEAINRLYETRIRNIGSNFRSSPTLHNSLRNRFRNEWRDALEIQKLSTLHTAPVMP